MKILITFHDFLALEIEIVIIYTRKFIVSINTDTTCIGCKLKILRKTLSLFPQQYVDKLKAFNIHFRIVLDTIGTYQKFPYL